MRTLLLIHLSVSIATLLMLNIAAPVLYFLDIKEILGTRRAVSFAFSGKVPASGKIENAIVSFIPVMNVYAVLSLNKMWVLLSETVKMLAKAEAEKKEEPYE